MSASSALHFSVMLLQRNHRAACNSIWSLSFDYEQHQSGFVESAEDRRTTLRHTIHREDSSEIKSSKFGLDRQ